MYNFPSLSTNEVEIYLEPATFLWDELITEEWYNNMGQILSNTNLLLN